MNQLYPAMTEYPRWTKRKPLGEPVATADQFGIDCGCRDTCGDVSEVDDHPAAECKGLPYS